ncbi:MgtC/SapB family protein [Clostridium sp.]|uniref:MgtC/SapB family protein n=1 Tax=Clostridium sp. TaxID=1506 RepID=UPI0026DC6EC5|nr:MgtC/SapB family protein [Clostridium sp.]MDO5040445.1 MgtC/SapB family protein [Clostridium sp.]
MKEIDILIRLMLSVIIGGIIGYDREFKNRPAGFRTHMLVCLGATISALIELQLGYFVINQIQLNQELLGSLKVDSGRIVAQVISGIGFLGAGTIIRNKGSIKGLTTAASIWAVACVGLAIGMGFYTISIISALIIFIVLVFLKKFQNKFITKIEIFKFEVTYKSNKNTIREIDRILSDEDINIKGIDFYYKECREEYIRNDENIYDIKRCVYSIEAPRNIDLNEIISDICSVEEVLSAKIIK